MARFILMVSAGEGVGFKFEMVYKVYFKLIKCSFSPILHMLKRASFF